jgi:hypothetical protein
MSLYYDRNGNPTDIAGFAAGQANFRVAEDQAGTHRVSTVWIGLATNAVGPPLIFETMVFDGDDHDVDSQRYATEAEAVEGHRRFVEKWSDR